jgi:ATP-dependent metalloprotease
MWKVIRYVGTAFVVMSAVGALVEQSAGAGGMAKGLLGGSAEPQPTIETSTTFEDVKGVDEAKAELEEIVHYLRNPKKYTQLGGKLPKGVMLVNNNNTHMSTSSDDLTSQNTRPSAATAHQSFGGLLDSFY